MVPKVSPVPPGAPEVPPFLNSRAPQPRGPAPRALLGTPARVENRPGRAGAQTSVPKSTSRARKPMSAAAGPTSPPLPPGPGFQGDLRDLRSSTGPDEALRGPTSPYEALQRPADPYTALRSPTEPYEALGSPTELRSPINFTAAQLTKRGGGPARQHNRIVIAIVMGFVTQRCIRSPLQ